MAGVLLTGSTNVTATTVASGATITGVKPSAAVTGDRLIAFTYNRNGTAPHTPPTGWTQLGAPVDTTAGALGVYAAVDPSSYAWTGGSGRQVVIIARSTDLASSPFGSAGTYATASNVGTADARQVLPSVDLTETYELLVAVVANNSTGGTPVGFTAPDGMSLVGTGATNTGGSDSTLSVFQQLVPAAGASGSRTAAHNGLNTGSGAGYLVGLLTVNKPAGSALTAIAGTSRTGVSVGTASSFTSSATGGTAPYSYAATQTAGPGVNLGGSGATRTFTAPSLQNAATLTWRVTVTDAVGATATDTVSFGVLADPNFQAGVSLPPLPTLPVIPTRVLPSDLAQITTDLVQARALAATLKAYVDQVVTT